MNESIFGKEEKGSTDPIYCVVSSVSSKISVKQTCNLSIASKSTNKKLLLAFCYKKVKQNWGKLLSWNLLVQEIWVICWILDIMALSLKTKPGLIWLFIKAIIVTSCASVWGDQLKASRQKEGLREAVQNHFRIFNRILFSYVKKELLVRYLQKLECWEINVARLPWSVLSLHTLLCSLNKEELFHLFLLNPNVS